MEIICGLDEAGRGPLAGPVSAGAVILPPDFPVELLDDSKALTEKRREKAEAVIKEKALWAIAFVNHDVIDQINILQASLLAMKNALDQVIQKFPEWIKMNGLEKSGWNAGMIRAIADGNKVPPVGIPCEAKVKADATYPAVMAASIIAKVGRDRLMKEYDLKYPEYGYAKHKGYPTKAHVEVCRKLGPSPIQRLSFTY